MSRHPDQDCDEKERPPSWRRNLEFIGPREGSAEVERYSGSAPAALADLTGQEPDQRQSKPLPPAKRVEQLRFMRSNAGLTTSTGERGTRYLQAGEKYSRQELIRQQSQAKNVRA
jgi:hypothetical protein